MSDLGSKLRTIVTPGLCVAVYKLKYPEGTLLDSRFFQKQFNPDYFEDFYDSVYHQALIPISRLPLDDLLAFDWTTLLPEPSATDYPEQALGLITMLDQQRGLTDGYGRRHSFAFFDPICEKLARQLIALPTETRPDGKQAWLSRGYTVEDWLVRTLWFWAPLVHADRFMVNDRQVLKAYLHAMRDEAKALCGQDDPFQSLEAADDLDVTLFPQIEREGPPRLSFHTPTQQASVADYTFWWIRILNAHFAITDSCGHYPYWIRWRGGEWNEADTDFMRKTYYYRYTSEDEPYLKQVHDDHLDNVWQPLGPNHRFEKA